MNNKILVHAYGAEVEPIQQAIALVADFVQKNPNCRDVGLYVATQYQLDERTSLAQALGPGPCKTLLAKQAVRIGPARMRLITERSLSKDAMPDAVLAIYADDAKLEKIERRGDLMLTVAVPWGPVEAVLGKWIAKWKPAEVGAARVVDD